ncbi:MAG: hypothetical protein ABJN39_09265 [Sulfitobacter sp.]|uniref:hypothetical protein n=1 Tax=Alphaproteobacteria TaxID=28211 RepID=UPI002943301E|nr:hypothetical protein [Sulfitobacter sp. LC.270.F.C4]WOI13563.1 hypothetical protein R1T45_01665 [Sulfitobacter sp. LC.270.F.C4]
MTDFATLVLGANTSGLLKAKTDLAAVTSAGAKTEAGVKKSMKGVEDAVRKVPAAANDASRSFEQFRASIDPAYAASRQFAAAQKEVARFVEQGTISQRVANGMLEQAASKYMGVATSAERAAAAQQASEQATEEATQAYTALRSSLDPLYASSRRYEAAQEQLNAALKQGVITQAEANRVLNLAEKEYLGLGNAAQTAGAKMGGNGGFAHQSRMAAMQLSQVAQQTAATGDFVRALAIQLPDLALGFGAVGIGIGVVAGALLPMAADLITGRDNAKELENAMDSLSQASYDYTSAADQAKMSVSELALEFGSAAEEAKRAFEFMQGVNLGKALDQLTVALGTMDFSELERLATIVKEGPAELEVLSDTYNKALAGLQEQFGVTGEQALKLRDHLNEIRTAKGPEEIVQTVDRLNQYLVSAFGSAQDIPPELREMVQRLLEAQTAAARITARLDGSANSANTAANAAANLSGQLSVAAQYAAQVAANLAMAPAGIQGFQNKAEQLTAQIAALDAGLGQITASAAGYRKELEQKYGLADAANEAERAYISGVINRQVKEFTNVQNLNEEYRNKITALNKVEKASKGAGGAASKAMKAAAKEAKKFADEIERLEFDADPLKKYNAELANLNELAANGLSDGAYAHAVAELNDEFANSDPMISKAGDAIADFVAGGLKGFDDLLGAFKNMLKQMIATAIANPIKLSLMGVGGGMAGTAAQAAAPGGGGLGNLMGIGGGAGGMFGSLLGAWGGGSGILGGASAALGAFTSGGISGGLSAVGAMATQATSGLAGLGTAIGAVALPVAAVAAVFSFFSSKTKILDKGLRITADATGTLVEEFEKIEKSRFWGLSKKKRTNYSPMEDDGPIKDAVDAIKDSALAMGDVLGLSADNFSSFASQISVSLKGLSDEEAQAEIQRAFGVLAKQFSYAALGHFQEEMGNVIREGETADQVLADLANSFTIVNEALTLFDTNLLDVSVASGVAARDLIELSGGLDAFSQKTGYLFTSMLTEAEQKARKVELAVDALNDTFGDIGEAIPDTHAEYMALVKAQDLTTQSGRDTYTALMDVAAAFVEVNGTAQQTKDALDAAAAENAAAVQAARAQAERDAQAALATATQDLRSAFAREMEATRAAFQSAISGLQDELTGARERLAASRAIANALEGALHDRVFPSVEAERQSQDRAAAYLRTLVGQGQINDLDALQAALQAVASPSADTYETLEGYRRDFYRTSGVIAELEKTAGFALNADEEAVLLLEKQISDMQAQSDLEVAMLQQQLDALLGIDEGILSLADAIKAFMAAQAAAEKAGSGGSSNGGAFGSDGPPPGFEHLADDPRYQPGGVYDYSVGSGANWRDYASPGIGLPPGFEHLASFDGGGYTGNGPRSGGLDGKGGFMAMMHPREVVTDTTKGGGVMAVSSDPEVRRELSKLNEYIRELVKINNKQERRLREIELQGETA